MTNLKIDQWIGGASGEAATPTNWSLGASPVSGNAAQLADADISGNVVQISGGYMEPSNQSETVQATGAADYFDVNSSNVNPTTVGVALGAGTQWVGNIDIDQGTLMTISGEAGASLWNYGTAIVGGDCSLVIGPSVNGVGTIETQSAKSAGSYLEFQGPVATGETIVLGYDDSILKIDNGMSFLGTVDVNAGGSTLNNSAEINFGAGAAAAQAYIYEGNELYLLGDVNNQWAVVDKIALVTSTPFTVEVTGWRGLGVSVDTAGAAAPPGVALPRWG